MRNTNIITPLWHKLLICILLAMFGSACSHANMLSRGIKGEIDHPTSLHISPLGNEVSHKPPLRITQAHDKIVYSFPGIHGPTYFSLFLLEHSIIHDGETVLDIGTGSGIQTIFAADKANRVLSIDINKKALENTLLNARRNNIADKINTRLSDLFKAIKPDEKFDVILSSLPYSYRKINGYAWELHERFFNNVQRHLNPGGRIYFLTGNLNNFVRTRKMIEKNNLKIMRMDMAAYIKDDVEMMVYTIQRKDDALKQNANYSLQVLTDLETDE